MTYEINNEQLTAIVEKAKELYGKERASQHHYILPVFIRNGKTLYKRSDSVEGLDLGVEGLAGDFSGTVEMGESFDWVFNMDQDPQITSRTASDDDIQIFFEYASKEIQYQKEYKESIVLYVIRQDDNEGVVVFGRRPKRKIDPLKNISWERDFGEGKEHDFIEKYSSFYVKEPIFPVVKANDLFPHAISLRFRVPFSVMGG